MNDQVKFCPFITRAKDQAPVPCLEKACGLWIENVEYEQSTFTGCSMRSIALILKAIWYDKDFKKG